MSQNKLIDKTKIDKELEEKKLKSSLIKNHQFIKSRFSENKSDFVIGPSFYELNQSHLFNTLNQEQQSQIIQIQSQKLLVEALLIEKMGIQLGEKMLKMAKSTQDAQLSALMCADEVLHFEIMKKYHHADDIDLEGECKKNSFISLIKEIIETCDYEQTVVLIQVILEGWGLRHYQNLLSNCVQTENSQYLQQDLQMILKDEAFHHSCGIQTARFYSLSDPKIKTIKYFLDQILYFISIGEASLINTFQEVDLDLTAKQIDTLKVEINEQKRVVDKTNYLISLIHKTDFGKIASYLEDKWQKH